MGSKQFDIHMGNIPNIIFLSPIQKGEKKTR